MNPRGNIYRKKGNEKILLRGNEMGRGTERLIGGTERVITSKWVKYTELVITMSIYS